MENIENKEVSLLDLVLILVKYRKLLVIGFVVSLILALGLFYVKPKIDTKKENEIEYTYNIRIYNFPYDVQKTVFGDSNKQFEGVNVPSYANSILNNTDFIAEANRIAPVITPVIEDNTLYVKNVDSAIQARKIATINNVSSGFIELKIRTNLGNKDLVDTFVKQLVKLSEEEMEKLFLTNLTNYRESAENVLKQVDLKKANQSVLNDLKVVNLVVNYQKSFKTFLRLQDNSSFTPIVHTVNKKKLIISFMAFMCVFLVVILILNMIDNIKNDQYERNKFQEAWNFGKWKSKK